MKRFVLMVMALLLLGCADYQQRANAQKSAYPLHIGMGPEAVLAQWGSPEQMTRLITPQGAVYTWRYATGASSWVWVTFRGGRVSSVYSSTQ